jgi:glycosyltransferase involved in cell wall biosynthesis
LPLIAQEMKIPSLISLHDYWPFCFQVRLVDWKGRQCGGPLQGGDCYRCIQGGNGGIVNKAMGLAKRMIPWEVRQQLRQRLVRQSASSYLAELSVEVIDRRYQSYQNAILSALRILTPSQFIKKQYIANGYPGDRIEVVPLGVEIPSTRLNLENRSRGEGLHFTFVGTLIPSKGLDVLIRAFKRLESQNVSLAVYGREDVAPFEYRSQLKELSQGDDRIRFLGPFSQEQRVQVYEKTDVVVIPSRFPETFSLVAHEALAFGKPVIASSIGALPEVVKDGVNGYLVDPGDEDALHALLERIIMNPTTLDLLDCPGPSQIYSINEHGDRIEEMYQEILNSNA